MNQKKIKQRIENFCNVFKISQEWIYDFFKFYQLNTLHTLGKHFGLKINTWNDFYKLPLTTKEDLRKWKVKKKGLTVHYTSGSTGEPLAIYGPEYLQYIKASIFIRAWENVGWDRKRPVLRLTAGKPQWKKADSYFNIIPMNYRTVNKRYVNWIIKNKPFLIHGGSGSIREITTLLKKSKSGLKAMKQINLYLMSEDTRLHKKILEKYWKNVYSGYGLGECCTVASEDKNHQMKINMETCIVESIKGELVITDLFNYITPVIRYRTKDLGFVKKDKILNLQGRGVDYYDGPEVKKPLSWWVLSPITHKYYDLINQWRVVVYPKRKHFILYVVWKDKPDYKRFKWYNYFIKKTTGLDLYILTKKEMSNKERLNLMEVRG